MITKKLARRALAGPSALVLGKREAACCCPSALFGICNSYDATGFLSRLQRAALFFGDRARNPYVMVAGILQIATKYPLEFVALGVIRQITYAPTVVAATRIL